MKKYLIISWWLYSTRIGKQVSQPVDTVLRSLGTMSFFFLHIIMTKIILENFAFLGWSKNEYWIYMFSFLTFYYAAFFFLWQGLKNTAFDINRGGFDYLLVKPISVRFLAFNRGATVNNLVSTVAGIVGLFYCLNHFGYHDRFIYIPVYFLLMAVSLWMIHCLSLIFVSLNFRFPGFESLRAVAFSMQEVYKYPVTNFERSPFLVKVIIVPFSLLVTIPATLILLKQINLWYIAGYFSLAVFLTIASKRVWRWGISNYTSAS